MAKPGSKATDSDGTPSHHTVFIDTNLGTHLVLLASSSDTVSDLKKKILLEHKLCFPTNGDIKIHALKVKRRGFFYHLSESMFVHHVFDGTKKNYFISVDASNIEENNDNQVAVNRDSNNQVPQVGTTKNVSTDGDNILLDSYPESLSHVDLSLPLDENTQLAKAKASFSDRLRVDAAGEEEGLNNLKMFEYTGDHHSKVTSLDDDNDRLGPPIQDKHDEHSKDNGGNSRNEIGDVQGSAPSEVLETGSRAKEKHKKKRKNKDEINDVALKENDASLCESGENGLQQETVAKKKHKIEESNGGESSVMENGMLISDSNKEVSGQPTISQHHLGNNQRNMHAVLDCLSTENLDGVNMPSACPSSGKRKKKKKSSNPIYQETAGVPSSTEDVGRESLADNPKDFGKEPDRAPISYQQVQGVTISESYAVSSKEQHVDPVQGDRRFSSQDIGMGDANAGNATSSHDAAEIPAPSAAKRRNSKNVILNDNEKTATDQDGGCKEERDLSHSESIPQQKCKPSAQNETEMRSEEAVVTSLAEASETVNPGTLSKKRKKTKKTRDLLIGSPTLGTEPVKSSVAVDAALTEPHKDANGDDSGNKGNQEKSKPVANEGKEVSKMDKEVVVTTEVVEASETVNPGTSSKKRKKSKRTRDSLSGTLTSGTEHAKGSVADASTEPHKAVNGDDSSVKCNQEESSLLAKEGKTMTEMDKGVVAASELVEVGETVNPGTSSKKKRKSKRIRDLSSETLTSGAEHVKGSVADTSTEPHKVVNGDDSNDMGHKEESNIPEEKGKSADADTVRTFHLATDREIDDVIQNVVVSAVDDHPSKIDHANKVGQVTKVSCESDTINFNDYFVPRESRHKTAASGEVVVDKANKAKAAASDMKSDKKKKKLAAHSHGPSSDIQASLRLNENGGIVERPQPGDSSTIKLQESVSNATGENVTIPLHKKPSKVSGSGVKAPLSTKSDRINYNPEEARISSVAMAAVKNIHEKINKEASDVSISSIESSRNIRASQHVSHKKNNQMSGRKAPVSNAGEVLNCSQRGKSLIGKSGSIFQDDNYGDSTNDGTDSTRTPSNSMSSDYSDGESNSDSDSSQNGSYSPKTKEGGVKNIKKPFSSGMNLETILRSSSRYKKAKLTASQSLPEDTESQPVDFVPDSQANP